MRRANRVAAALVGRCDALLFAACRVKQSESGAGVEFRFTSRFVDAACEREGVSQVSSACVRLELWRSALKLKSKEEHRRNPCGLCVSFARPLGCPRAF